MPAAVADNNDEDHHRDEPPAKRCGAWIVSRNEHPENGNCEKNGRERARACLKDNMPIPTHAPDLNAASAEKMMRATLQCALVGMDIVVCRRKQCDEDAE